jgi:hypothetical protein
MTSAITKVVAADPTDIRTAIPAISRSNSWITAAEQSGSSKIDQEKNSGMAKSS